MGDGGQSLNQSARQTNWNDLAKLVLHVKVPFNMLELACVNLLGQMCLHFARMKSQCALLDLSSHSRENHVCCENLICMSALWNYLMIGMSPCVSVHGYLALLAVVSGSGSNTPQSGHPYAARTPPAAAPRPAAAAHLPRGLRKNQVGTASNKEPTKNVVLLRVSQGHPQETRSHTHTLTHTHTQMRFLKRAS